MDFGLMAFAIGFTTFQGLYSSAQGIGRLGLHARIHEMAFR